MFSVKIEVEDKNECLSACYGCLSVGRQLNPLKNYADVYLNLLRKEQGLAEYSDIMVCWECMALLKKLHSFQQRVQYSYYYLQSIGNVVDKPKPELSTLSTIRKDYYDKTYDHDEVELPHNTNPEAFVSLDEIKQEIDQTEECVMKTEPSWSDADLPDNDDTYIPPVAKKKYKCEAESVTKIKNVVDMDNIHQYFTLKNYNRKEIEDMIEKKKNTKRYRLRNYRCDSCAMAFKDSRTLKKHMKVIHEKSKHTYTCDECGMTFYNRMAITMHWKQYHYTYRCNLCMNAYNTVNLQKYHLTKLHKYTYRCEECDWSFGLYSDYLKHRSAIHRRVLCDYCGKSFTKKARLEQHILVKHCVPTCHICNYTFKKYRTLRNHNDLKHPELMPASNTESSYCVECDLQFDNVTKFKQHLSYSVKHKPPVRISVPCPECGKLFTRKTYMNNHFKLFHIKKSNHYCEPCDKYFITGYTLRLHKKTVHDKVIAPRDKMCNVCGRGFSTNRILINHMRTHTGERPYKCSHCSAAFAQQTAMKTHERAIHKMHS